MQVSDDSGSASDGSGGSSAGTTSPTEATSAGSGDASGTTGEPDTTSEGGSGPTTGPAESSSGEAPMTWCEDQPGTILVCHDFDGPVAFLGAALFEEHGTVDVSDEQWTSPPYSMRVEVLPDAVEPSNASLGQALVGATLPFDGVVSTRMWIEPECFASGAATVQRLALALQYAGGTEPEGPFELNTTIWFTADDVVYYESDQPQGYGDNTVGHALGVALATSEWHTLSIAHDAASSAVNVTIDGLPHDFALSLATQDVIAEIADTTPAIAVGTTMANNQPGCTMYFDDVIVTE
jgi:hypothetical protein